MRTKSLREFENSVSEINNNLSHTIFVFNQFKLDNSQKILSHPEEFTTTVYQENELASQFNVRLSGIENQAQNTLNYILDTLFVFTNTHFEVYLKDVYLFVKDNFYSQLPEPPDSKVFDTIIESLGINTETEIDNLLVSTYDYFKFRRNAIIHRHRDKRFHGVLELLTTGGFRRDKKKKHLFRERQLNGQELNLHWREHREALQKNITKGHKIQTFDFASRDVSRFSLNDLIDVFNFYRLYAEKLDALIINKIQRQKLLDFCANKFSKTIGDKSNFTSEEFFKKINRIAKQELNLTLENAETTQLYNGV
jgi:hypothetical protein